MPESSGGRYRAPREYGAWVAGEWYAPGRLLPAGTTEYRVTAIENLSGTKHGWRTVSAMITAGTSFEDIEDEIYELFSDLAEDYGVEY